MKRNDFSEQEIEQMLKNASGEVPDSSPEFEKNLMKRVMERKAELESESDRDDFWQGFNTDEPALTDEPVLNDEENEENEENEEIEQKHSAKIIHWKELIAIAAVFVFLIGGTLLTRGRLRDAGSSQSPVTHTIGGEKDPAGSKIDSSKIVDASDRKETISQENDSYSFFQDMGLFVRASLPYLAIAAGGAAIWIIIYRKRKSQK